MEVVFKGFQTIIPLWLLILFLAAATVLAWWSYKDIRIAPRYRYTLITLRSAAFMILLALLASPFFTAQQTYSEKSEVLVFLDNSASTAIQKGSYSGSTSYQKVLADLQFEGRDDVQLRFFTVADSIRSEPPDSLSLEAPQTNLFNFITTIRNRENARTAVLISDGIYTRGRNPLFQITASDIPIQTIALGDTASQKDIYIKNVAVNETGYVNSTQKVEVTVVQNGFGEQNFRILLKNKNEVMNSRNVSLPGQSSSRTFSFQLEHKQAGLQQFEVEIPPLQNEWTAKNNRQSFAIDVIDNKQHILSVAFEIHPDVRLLRSLLAADKNTVLSSRTWLGGSRFMEGPLNFNADSLDLLIMHGYPQAGLPDEIKRTVTALLQRVPVITMATPTFDYSQLAADATLSFPVSVGGPLSFGRVTPEPSAGATVHPVMDLPEVDQNALPALYGAISGLQLNPGAEKLYESKFEGRATASPLLAVQQSGNLRRAQITAFNWYRMNQHPSEAVRGYARQLLLNTVSWAAAKPEDRNLTIRPARQSFEATETIILNGFLINERGQKESGAQIEVQVSGENIEPRTFSMQSRGQGQYRLSVNALPEGIYNFAARARIGEREIGEHSGQFSVSASNAEFINTRRNDPLLRGLANKTGGTFYEMEEAKTLWQDLEQKNMLNREEKISETIFYPNRHFFWFLLLVLLLTAEWSIRKYVALP